MMRADDPRSIRVSVVPALADIVDAPEQPAIIAVDMPIGLPDRTQGSGRLPEQLIRPLLGQRQSSVFSAAQGFTAGVRYLPEDPGDRRTPACAAGSHLQAS
jgi:predicted RNase H-like nuclease